MALQGSEEVFFGSVCGYALVLRGAECGGETLGKVLSVQGSDIGHAQGVLDVADIEPACDLPGGESRHTQFVAEFCEFRGIFSVQVFRIGHFATSGFVSGGKSRQKIKIFEAGRTILNFYPYICGA